MNQQQKEELVKYRFAKSLEALRRRAQLFFCHL
jgi:hypothetical protein